MIKMKKILVLISIFALVTPLSYSNGGCIKMVDDILVQLSNSPLVPIAGKETSFLISFANIKKELISEEINGKILITKDDEKILTKNFRIKDGILDLKHIFKKEGMYEIFLEFDFKNKTYTPEDFLIEVKEEKNNFVANILFLIVGIAIGFFAAKFYKK